MAYNDGGYLFGGTSGEGLYKSSKPMKKLYFYTAINPEEKKTVEKLKESESFAPQTGQEENGFFSKMKDIF